MPIPRQLSLLKWVRIETQKRSLNPQGLLDHLRDEIRKQVLVEQGYQHTTNNRMEMIACIVAQDALKRECAIAVYSDSKYLVDGVSKGWAIKWKRNNWKRSGGVRAENVDLW